MEMEWILSSNSKEREYELHSSPNLTKTWVLAVRTDCFCWNQEMKEEFAEDSSRFLRLPEGHTDLFLYKILEAAVAVNFCLRSYGD